MRIINIIELPKHKGTYSFNMLTPPFIIDFTSFPKEFSFEKQLAEIRLWNKEKFGNSIKITKKGNNKLIFEI